MWLASVAHLSLIVTYKTVLSCQLFYVILPDRRILQVASSCKYGIPVEKSGNIINDHRFCVIKLRQLCWVVHATRMKEEKRYWVSVTRPKWKRGFLVKYGDSTDVNVKETGSKGNYWVYMTQVRDECRTPDSVLMNIRVAWIWGNF